MIRFCSSGTVARADLDAEIAARDHQRVGLARAISSSSSTASAFSIFAITARVEPRARDELLQLADVGRRADERERDVVDAEPEREARDRAGPSRSATGPGSATPGRLTPLFERDLAADERRGSGRGRPSSSLDERAGSGRRRSARRGRARARRRSPRARRQVAVLRAVVAGDHDGLARDAAGAARRSAPTRSFGPWRSAISASGRPSSSWTARVIAARAACSSCVPCEKFSRAASIPASAKRADDLVRGRPRADRGDDLRPSDRTVHDRDHRGLADVRPRERRPAGIHGPLAELLLDPQQLVVLRDAIGAGGRAGLDLAGVGGDGEVGDRRVLGLAGAVRDDGGVAGVAAPAAIASSVSVSVPIWLTFTRIELPTPSSMPRRRRSGFVTKRSSPTSWTESPSSRVSCVQPSQSSSAAPSSIDDDRVARRRGSSQNADQLVARRARGPRSGRRRRGTPRWSPGRARSRSGRAPPARSAASRIASIAASLEARSGAKPPSSPTAVARPRSCSTRPQRVVDLGAELQRLARTSRRRPGRP